MENKQFEEKVVNPQKSILQFFKSPNKDPLKKTNALFSLFNPVKPKPKDNNTVNNEACLK